MQAGVIGIIDGEFDEMESFHQTQEQDGTTFSKSLQINQKPKTDMGYRAYVGEAAIQIIDEKETVNINPETGEIEVGEYPTKISKHTEFIAVPGEFVVVKSGSGTFAFDLIQSYYPGTHVERVRLDVNAYAEDYYTADEVDPWQIGFYGNIGKAEKGVVYGENVISDNDIGDVLARSQLNQLGLRYEMMGHDMKISMTESGYIQVYNPSNFESKDFAEYILEEVLQYDKDREVVPVMG